MQKSGYFLNAGCIMYSISIFYFTFYFFGGAYAPSTPPCLRACLRLPSQLQGLIAPWPVPNYTAWSERQTGVNNLLKVVVWKREIESQTCDLQRRKSNAMTTTPPLYTVHTEKIIHPMCENLEDNYLRTLAAKYAVGVYVTGRVSVRMSVPSIDSIASKKQRWAASLLQRTGID